MFVTGTPSTVTLAEMTLVLRTRWGLLPTAEELEELFVEEPS
jgi:hypothetical protein